jgi:hypothetical protein
LDHIAEVAFSSLGVIGTLLFVDVSLTRAKKEDNRGDIVKIILGVALVLIGFFLRYWYGIYTKAGSFYLISVIALSVIPIFGYALGGYKSTFVAFCILFGLYILIIIVIIVLALMFQV